MSRSPHLADYSAGIGTLPARWQAGCRASSGRFPPPLWMRADMSAHLKLYRCWLLAYLSITRKEVACQEIIMCPIPTSSSIYLARVTMYQCGSP